MKEFFPCVYRVHGKLATLNSTPGYRVYGEKLVKQGKREYRVWDPFRSKLAAALANKLGCMPIKKDSNVLYLGASTGTTASHVADITSGLVYCVEFSQRMMRELLPVCMKKRNMIPILGDARHPWEYAHNIASRIDIVYQDVAQKNQAEILVNNMNYYKAKHGLLAIKCRSINSVKDPRKVVKEELGKIGDAYKVIESVNLKPYDKDHILAVVERI